MSEIKVLLVSILILLLSLKGLNSSSTSNDAVNSSGDKSKTSEAKKESSIIGSSSNVQPQYMMPPNVNGYPVHYQNGNGMMMPGTPAQIPQYLLQGSQPPIENTQNSLSDLKSEISTLKDTVLLLSSVVKQNALQNGDPRSGDHGNDFLQTRNSNYPPQGNSNYQPSAGDYHNRDDDISIDIYQSNKGGGYHQQPGQKKVVKEHPKPVSQTTSSTTTTIIDDKTNVKRTINLLPGATSVTQAERTFAVIKRGIKNAVVTGVIVTLVKLLPLLWAGLRLIFNAILPLVGMSLLNKNGMTGQLTKTITTAITAPASDTTPAPPSILLNNDVLDEELANLEDSFDIFKGKLY